ncbi:MAG: flagellar hook-basal body complex protein, partial [Planctomycetota bacterium]
DNATYRWFADSGENDPAGVDHEIAVGTGLIEFDGDGNMVEVSNANVSIGRNDTPATNPLDFELDFSQLSGFSDEDSEISVSRQDGSQLTQLTEYSVGEDGLITGIFDNGMSRTLGQVRLARFTNPTGLDQLGNNMYNVAFNSGLPIEGNPGDQGLGTITAGAVELSNTDTGEDLIELLTASTQYRANSRVISTSQQLLDVLMNMRQ